ncbi:Hsp20/alpha crystallin family protein [Alkalicella caledoniensis]|uniref:Hsp20/alpha crystallin family protein n=1 Tax=Alkalicella caledoniensis TaxID=2731377 RepID=A0A7G9W4V3_ALKCA|nr:Hsp20/alpha crystallin family protein [Alkalicella caledoniensis]QNO13715.1 Hsp20/alpha crystallin family protein [Alkalicella caledoniensis]
MGRAIIRRKVREHLDLTPAFEPDVDVVETHEYLRIAADIPGVHFDDMDILIADDSVIIRGERKGEAIYNHGEEFRIMERKMGKIFRQVPITADILSDETELYYEDGVLVVHMPKNQNYH